MCANIYEDPNLVMDMGYNRQVQKDGGEAEERVVAIYESAGTFTDHENNLLPRDREANSPKPRPGARRNPFKAAVVVLVLLCVILLTTILVLVIFYRDSVTYKGRYEKLQVKYENLSNSFCVSQENGTDQWSRFHCSCYFRSAEKRNWTESRADCQRRGADLAMINSRQEQIFLGKFTHHEESWIGLQSEFKNGKYEWMWIDKSKPTHLGWKINVPTTASKSAKVYVDKDGHLNHDSAGLRRWICEKQISRGFPDDP